MELFTDDDLTGVSYVAGFTPAKALATCCLLEELGDAITGMPSDDIGGVWSRMWSVLTLVGHAGLPVFALSAIDIALWDLRAKSRDLANVRQVAGRRVMVAIAPLRLVGGDGSPVRAAAWDSNDETEGGHDGH